MRTNRNRQTAIDAPTLSLLLIGVPACLRVLGAWVDAGGNTPAFWRQALLIAGIAAVAVAGTWWIILPRARRRAATSIGARRAQRLSYLITILGLLLLVELLWLDIRQVTATGDMFQDAANLARTTVTLGAVWGMLAGVTLQAAHLPPARGWDMHRLGIAELNVILQLSVAALLLLPVNPPTGATAWLAPVLAVGVALFIGQIALQVLRRPGAAVMVFAAAIFYRALANFVLIQIPEAETVGAAVYFLALAAAGAQDMTYATRLADADVQRTFHFALAAGVSVSIAVALIFWPQLLGVSPLTPERAILVIGLGAPIGVGGGWCGAIYGRAAGRKGG
jgi:hypothetical protein